MNLEQDLLNEIYHEFVLLGEYLTRIEGVMVAFEKEAEAKSNKKDASLNDRLIAYIKLASKFPQHFRYSYVLLLYSMVEDFLGQTCDLLQDIRNFPITRKDLRGDNLETELYRPLRAS